MSDHDQIPRRARLDQMVGAERAITGAMGAVELMPPDERLTEAVTLLGRARDAVADYVDDTGYLDPPVADVDDVDDEFDHGDPDAA
jgi:hypothetical protein